MGLKLEGVTTHGKADAFKFNPCELVPRFAAFTGRVERSEEAIDAMAQSLLLNGQEQSFLFRKDSGGRPVPINGHTRILAAARITERRMGIYSPEQPFVLLGVYRQINEEEALWHTFAENDEDSRTPLSAVDIAFFIRTVSETLGLKDAEIAKKLGKNPNWVSRHRKVLDLDNQTQQALAVGKVNMDAVVNVLHKMPKEKRAEVIKASNGTAASVAKAAREVGVQTARSDAEFKAWVKATSKKVSTPARMFLDAILDYRAGTVDDAELTEMFVELVG